MKKRSRNTLLWTHLWHFHHLLIFQWGAGVRVLTMNFLQKAKCLNSFGMDCRPLTTDLSGQVFSRKNIKNHSMNIKHRNLCIKWSFVFSQQFFDACTHFWCDSPCIKVANLVFNPSSWKKTESKRKLVRIHSATWKMNPLTYKGRHTHNFWEPGN